MGLLSGLLFLPVTAPARGFRLFLEQLRDEADAVLYDEGRAFAELIDLSMRHQTGQLTDAEFAEQEAVLIERLGALRDEQDEEDELLGADAESDFDDDDGFDGELDEDDEGQLDAEPDLDDGDDDQLDTEPELDAEEW